MGMIIWQVAVIFILSLLVLDDYICYIHGDLDLVAPKYTIIAQEKH